MLHAVTGKSMLNILDCLISEEIEKIRKNSGESGLLDTINARERDIKPSVVSDKP